VLVVLVAVAALVAVVALTHVAQDRAQQRVALERAAERQAFALEREQWLQERQLLLNRVVDPTAGVAQSLVIGQAAFDPSQEQEWPDYVPQGPEMPDFPGQGERTLT